MSKSSIEWTGSTRNPIRARNLETGQVGTWCQMISPGCAHCYAQRHNLRNLPHGSSGLPYTAQGGEQAEIFLDPEILAEPLRRRKAEVYFPCSMTDLFQAAHSLEMIAAVWGVMAACHQHTFQVLTKRPKRAKEFLAWLASTALSPGQRLTGVLTALPMDYPRRLDLTASWPLPNVWLGTSVENQECADKRIPDLLASPAAVRFLSIEPLLAPVDLRFPGVVKRIKPEGFDDLSPKRQEEVIEQAARAEYIARAGMVDWVIAGGESGHGARPMHPSWVSSLRDQCTGAGVPFFFKQWGEWRPWEPGFHGVVKHISARDGALGSEATYVNIMRDGKAAIERRCDTVPIVKAGKGVAGRTLAGRTWDEMPEVARG